MKAFIFFEKIFGAHYIFSHHLPSKSNQFGKANLNSYKIILMHLAMLSPRVGGAAYPRDFDSDSFPLGRDFDT